MTVIVFSKDRPLQLDSTLRSFQRHCLDFYQVTVRIIVKASSELYGQGYQLLEKQYSSYTNIIFIPETDFHQQVLNILKTEEYVLWLVDDNLFVRNLKLTECQQLLEINQDALGYSLRLGQNTTYCYPLNKQQTIPNFQQISGTTYKYKWTAAEFDFGYPLEVSSSLYRTRELLPLLTSINFSNPNSLEAEIATRASCFREGLPWLLCPITSVTFCNPINKVQNTAGENRSGESAEFSSGSLLDCFLRGKRINVVALDGFTPNACHQEVELLFAEVKVSDPKVSVIIPCYDQAHYLAEAVESVVAQTFTDWECIIVNDGSPDNASEVATELIERHPDKRLRLLEKPNGGLADARNYGIERAKGTYILPLDSDDVLHSEMLKRTVEVIESHLTIAIVYTDLVHFGAVQKHVIAGEYDFQSLKRANQLNYCSLYRREVWEKVGGYNTNMTWGYEDWDFWIGAGERGYAAEHISEALLFYRVKSVSMFAKALEHDAELKAQIVLNHPQLYSEQERLWAWEVLGKLETLLPLVSVIVPTHNRPEMLKDTIQSILDQTFQNFEIIVVNDAGQDVSSVVQSFNSQKISYLSHEANKGLAAARNTGIRAAKGKYIAYLDDDDIFYPEHLETLVTFLQVNGEKVAYTDAFRAHQTMQDDGTYAITGRDVPYSFDFDFKHILIGNFIPVTCFMHDLRCIQEAGYFDEDLRSHEDWDLWIRISQKFKFHHIKKITCEFRWREDGSSMTSSKEMEFISTQERIYDKYQYITSKMPDVAKAQKREIYNRKKRAEISASIACSIVIPVYNQVAHTKLCLEMLYANAPANLSFEVIVVDNASIDDTAEFLNGATQRYRNLRVIKNNMNLMFAKACNQGGQAAQGEFLVFLNNDTVVTPGWLATMIEACGPDVGIIGCRMLYPDGTIQHAGIELINGIPDHPYRHQPADMPAANTSRDLDMVTGACLLIRRELFLQLAGFDEVYRNGVEDVDLCLRAREAGYRVVYQPKAMIYHHEGQSSGRFDHVDRNLRFFIDRWQGRFDKKDRFIASNPPVLMTAEKSYINEQPLHVVWQGSQFVYHSLALINREMCRRLIQIGHELSIVPYEQDEFFPEAGSPLAAIQECVNRPLSQPADVVVRHQWPPDFNPPPAGHWVMIQPWEFGSIPLSWIGPMNEKLDEIWVPSSYVRECYIQSGVCRDKVFVVPNGVDTALYSPVGATYPITSGKSFRFLFVGGTIQRKGIDLLLAAYRQSFTAQDDVCLVIKDMGGKSFYQGQTAKEMIQRFSADPAAPEIVYIDSSLTSDEMTALYRSCHCLVHPYRGEGFGLPIAEAMASGLPVIVTGYGAALDFCPPDIAWLVPAKEVRFATCCVGDIDTVGPPWLAEPDLDVLSDRMQHAFNHPDEARRRGQAACEYIRGNFTWDRAAHCVEARLRALRAKPVVRFTKGKITLRVADKADRPADDEAKRRDVAARVMEQARVLQLRGETDAAVTMLIRQGIGVSPEWPVPYLALAELLMGEKRFADAMQVVKEMPPATEPTVKREIEAICQAALGDDEAARKSANQAPERPRALVVLGTLAARRGDLTGAEAFFRRAIGVDSSCGSAWLSLGMVVWGQGKQEDAWQAVKRSVLVDPLNGEAAGIMRDMAARRDQAEKQV